MRVDSRGQGKLTSNTELVTGRAKELLFFCIKQPFMQKIFSTSRATDSWYQHVSAHISCSIHTAVQGILYHQEHGCLSSPLWWTTDPTSFSFSLHVISEISLDTGLKGSNLETFSCFTQTRFLPSHPPFDQWDCRLEGDTSWDPQGKARMEAG